MIVFLVLGGWAVLVLAISVVDNSVEAWEGFGGRRNRLPPLILGSDAGKKARESDEIWISERGFSFLD